MDGKPPTKSRFSLNSDVFQKRLNKRRNSYRVIQVTRVSRIRDGSIGPMVG